LVNNNNNKHNNFKGHPCELSVKEKDLPDYDFICEICEENFEKGSISYSCKKCDYDICHLCRFKK